MLSELSMVWAIDGLSSSIMRFSLRLKLTLVSLVLLIIPLVGIRLSTSIKTHLMDTREETLMFSARAVATALTGRTGLFDQEMFHALDEEKDIYLFELTNPMRLNGKLDDWQPQLKNASKYSFEHQIFPLARAPYSSLHFTHMVGTRRGYLYAVFIVTDDKIVYRDKKSLHLNRSDHLQISIEDKENRLHKYVISAKKPGWVNGYLVPSDPKDSFVALNEPKIQGVWRETKEGYILEIRIPMHMVGKKLAFAVADVDNERLRDIATIITTANPKTSEKLGWLLPQSDEISQILESLNRQNSLIQVVDINKRVRAAIGNLSDDTGDEELPKKTPLSWLNTTLQPLFRLFIEPFSTDFKSVPTQLSTLDIEGIDDALQGKEFITRYRLSKDNVEIMAAITPLKENGEIIGAIVVEQTTNSILALKNKVIEESITISLLTFLVTSLGILFFASRLSSRIRKLRNQAASAIGKNGQIQGYITPVKAKDEIGDLSLTLSTLLQQLKQQIEYKEKMADNLEHEMRTPLAGISAALKNISEELENPPEAIKNYISWALSDAKRLEHLLSAIRDATNLNEALDHDSHEVFNLSEAAKIWLNRSWQVAFPKALFELEISNEVLEINGDPARIKQMIDKLIDNGISFQKENTPLKISLWEKNQKINISVYNQGPIIPAENLLHIFNSMVSHRKQKRSSPHLGLGLYIVRIITEHHNGTIIAENLTGENQGVKFTISLPKATH